MNAFNTLKRYIEVLNESVLLYDMSQVFHMHYCHVRSIKQECNFDMQAFTHKKLDILHYGPNKR